MMEFANPSGDTNTNWLLIERLAKAGGVSQVAISMVGESKDAESANRMLVKACRDIAALVDVDKMGAEQ